MAHFPCHKCKRFGHFRKQCSTKAAKPPPPHPKHGAATCAACGAAGCGGTVSPRSRYAFVMQ